MVNSAAKSFADLIGCWPADSGRTSIATFAADIRAPYPTAQVMRFRNSIPSAYWPRVVSAARRRGLEYVTLEWLVEMRVKRKSRPNRRGSVTREVAA